MSALKEVTFYKRRKDRPPEIEMAADFFAENGWTLCEEWVDPWYDEEEQEEHEGGWMYSLVYEEKIGEQLHGWQMAPIHSLAFPEIWKHDLKLAQMGWERYREELG